MDKKRLKLLLLSKDMNFTIFSKQIGINKDTFYRKLRYDGEKFTLKELKKIKDLLGLNDEDFLSIFFK